MTNPDSSHRPSDDDPHGNRRQSSPPPTPRWVYGFGIIAILLVLAFIVTHLAGGGFRTHTLP